MACFSLPFSFSKSFQPTSSFRNSIASIASSIAVLMSPPIEIPSLKRHLPPSSPTDRDASIKRAALDPCASPFVLQPSPTDQDASVRGAALDPCASPFVPPSSSTSPTTEDVFTASIYSSYTQLARSCSPFRGSRLMCRRSNADPAILNSEPSSR
jgi:hypothetical protein